MMEFVLEFVSQKIKKLEYMTAKEILYRILNTSYIFLFSGWTYCSCQKFQGCSLPNWEKNYCHICKFMLDYHPQKMHKIHDPKEILNTYISMKKDLENCVNFDPSVDEFCLYDFQFNWRNLNGTQHSCYLKNTYFY